jgi:hypothetical protein
MIEPVPDLPRAEGRRADVRQCLGQFLTVEPDDVAPPIRRFRRWRKNLRMLSRAHDL